MESLGLSVFFLSSFSGESLGPCRVGEPCPAPLRVAMRSPLPFPCVPDRPYKILLVCRWGPCPSPTPRLACAFYLLEPEEEKENPQKRKRKVSSPTTNKKENLQKRIQQRLSSTAHRFDTGTKRGTAGDGPLEGAVVLIKVGTIGGQSNPRAP